MSYQSGLLNQSDRDRIHTMLIQNSLLKNLPTSISPENLTAAMQNDKKIALDRLRLIALTAIGNAIVTDEIPQKTIVNVWKKYSHSFQEN